MIQFDNINKLWPDGTKALSDISLKIPRGQFCVILGPSGAGKSTLLRAVNGLMTPTQGQVKIDGTTLSLSTQKQLRRRVAMIHQHFNLTSRLSVASSVLSGLLPAVSTARALSGWFKSAHRRKACELLQRVGLTPTHLKRRAGDLSGGQQQRVGIARAFMLDPEVVLADEPVASLDPATAERLLALLHGICRSDGLTLVVSLHQVEFARQFADRIVGLQAGSVVFDGTPSELTPDRAESLYGAATETLPPKRPVPNVVPFQPAGALS